MRRDAPMCPVADVVVASGVDVEETGEDVAVAAHLDLVAKETGSAPIRIATTATLRGGKSAIGARPLGPRVQEAEMMVASVAVAVVGEVVSVVAWIEDVEVVSVVAWIEDVEAASEIAGVEDSGVDVEETEVALQTETETAEETGEIGHIELSGVDPPARVKVNESVCLLIVFGPIKFQPWMVFYENVGCETFK